MIENLKVNTPIKLNRQLKNPSGVKNIYSSILITWLDTALILADMSNEEIRVGVSPHCFLIGWNNNRLCSHPDRNRNVSVSFQVLFTNVDVAWISWTMLAVLHLAVLIVFLDIFLLICSQIKRLFVQLSYKFLIRGIFYQITKVDRKENCLFKVTIFNPLSLLGLLAKIKV